MALDEPVANQSCMKGGIALASGSAGVTAAVAGPVGPAFTGSPALPVLPQWRDPAAPWLVVQHAPFAGAKARLALRSAGFEVHWPREVVRRSRADDVLHPFFPGYLFALPEDAGVTWAEAKHQPYIVGLCGVREFGRPVHPPRGFVLALIKRAGEALDGVIPAKEDEIAERRRVSFERGEAVRITAGSFAGLEAVFHCAREDRVQVLLSIFGRDCPAEVPRDVVAKRG